MENTARSTWLYREPYRFADDEESPTEDLFTADESDEISIEHPPKRSRIGNVKGFFMLLLAGATDLFQLLLTAGVVGLILNTIIGFIAWLWLSLWLMFSDVSFLDKGAKIAITACTSMLIEFLPILNNLPATTVGIFVIILIVRAEDLVYNKTRGKVDIRVV